MAFHVVYSPWSASLCLDHITMYNVYILRLYEGKNHCSWDIYLEWLCLHFFFFSIYPRHEINQLYLHMKISLLIMFCEYLLMLLPKVASCSFDLSAYRHLFAKPTNLVIISLWLCMTSLWYIIENEWVTPNTKTPKTGGKSDNSESDFLKIAHLRSSMHLNLCKWRTEMKSRRGFIVFLVVFF